MEINYGGDRWWRYKVETVGGDSGNEENWKFIVNVFTLLFPECTFGAMTPNEL